MQESKKNTLYVFLFLEKETKCIKQWKIQYQFHDAK